MAEAPAAAISPHFWVRESDAGDFDEQQPWVWAWAASKSCLVDDAPAAASLHLQSAQVVSIAFSPLLARDGAPSCYLACYARYYNAQFHAV